MVLILPPKPSKDGVKVSYVIFECRVINHHPLEMSFYPTSLVFLESLSAFKNT